MSWWGSLVGNVAEVLNLVAPPRLTDLVHFHLGRRFPDSPAAAGRRRETEGEGDRTG